jgi:hypothetical protein
MSESHLVLPTIMRRVSAVIITIVLMNGCVVVHKMKLVATGGSRSLRERPAGTAPNSPALPGLLILALDGIDRSLLYAMLGAGELPAIATLLGGSRGAYFPHAHFDETLLSTLPSSTLAAWVTTFTGVPPSVHGVSGNEFFIRSERRFAAPAPVGFDDPAPVVATYYDDYVNDLVHVPTVYERMRQRDPDVLIWVAMHQLYRGADRLMLARRTVMFDAFEAYAQAELAEAADQKKSRKVYQALDEEVVDDVAEALADGPVPDVLTVYVAGSDLFAHVATDGPDTARRAYLHEVVDPLVGRLGEALVARGALANRYVIVTADHGHTAVEHDERHALGAGDASPPAAVVQAAGYRLRPFRLETKREDFDAVLAYGGAFAYVYAADRSTCPRPGDVCAWTHPPRFAEDVLPLAERFYVNNLDGRDVPAMRGTLDMILTRRPRAQPEDDVPFDVYVGNGQLVPVARYLQTHPHPTYVDVERRLRDLAAGPLGERAGDILLIAHSGDRERPEDRYYFAAPYRSWHGSPSKRDSEIPLIVAHPLQTGEKIGRRVRAALGDTRRQERVTDLLMALRFNHTSTEQERAALE